MKSAEWKALGFQGLIHLGLVALYWFSLTMLGSEGLKNLHDLSWVGVCGLAVNRLVAFILPVQAWFAARKSSNQVLANSLRGYAIGDLITSVLSTLAMFLPIPPILSLGSFVVASVVLGGLLGWRNQTRIVVTRTISLSDAELGEIIQNVHQWNAGKWTPEAIRIMFTLPANHWILLTASLQGRSVGYLLLAFDRPGQRIQLPIERIFPEIQAVFLEKIRAEAVFTIVEPGHRNKLVLRKLFLKTFWSLVFVIKANVILAEVEPVKLRLYKMMGLPVEKLADRSIDYMGGPCFQAAIRLGRKRVLEGMIAILVSGSPRLFRRRKK